MRIRWVVVAPLAVILSAVVPACKREDDQSRCSRREALRPGGSTARNVDACVERLRTVFGANEGACLRACMTKPTSFWDEQDCEDDCTGATIGWPDWRCNVGDPGPAGAHPDRATVCSARFKQANDTNAPGFKAASRCARRGKDVNESLACADRFGLPPWTPR